MGFRTSAIMPFETPKSARVILLVLSEGYARGSVSPCAWATVQRIASSILQQWTGVFELSRYVASRTLL
jgi:hypothetical protein